MAKPASSLTARGREDWEFSHVKNFQIDLAYDFRPLLHPFSLFRINLSHYQCQSSQKGSQQAKPKNSFGIGTAFLKPMLRIPHRAWRKKQLLQIMRAYFYLYSYFSLSFLLHVTENVEGGERDCLREPALISFIKGTKNQKQVKTPLAFISLQNKKAPSNKRFDKNKKGG